MIKHFDDEVQFKKELDSLGVRYGSLENKYRFLCEFVDNKGGTVISHGVYASPIVALRQLPDILKQVKLPIDDVDTIVRFAYHLDDRNLTVLPAEIVPYCVSFLDLVKRNSLHSASPVPKSRKSSISAPSVFLSNSKPML